MNNKKKIRTRTERTGKKGNNKNKNRKIMRRN